MIYRKACRWKFEERDCSEALERIRMSRPRETMSFVVAPIRQLDQCPLCEGGPVLLRVDCVLLSNGVRLTSQTRYWMCSECGYQEQERASKDLTERSG